jgi:hypothetical protein
MPARAETLDRGRRFNALRSLSSASLARRSLPASTADASTTSVGVSSQRGCARRDAKRVPCLHSLKERHAGYHRRIQRPIGRPDRRAAHEGVLDPWRRPCGGPIAAQIRQRTIPAAGCQGAQRSTRPPPASLPRGGVFLKVAALRRSAARRGLRDRAEWDPALRRVHELEDHEGFRGGAAWPTGICGCPRR